MCAYICSEERLIVFDFSTLYICAEAAGNDHEHFSFMQHFGLDRILSIVEVASFDPTAAEEELPSTRSGLNQPTKQVGFFLLLWSVSCV